MLIHHSNMEQTAAGLTPDSLVNKWTDAVSIQQYTVTQKLPPWQQNIFSSIIAAIGKQLKQSVNVFHSRMLNRRLP